MPGVIEKTQYADTVAVPVDLSDRRGVQVGAEEDVRRRVERVADHRLDRRDVRDDDDGLAGVGLDKAFPGGGDPREGRGERLPGRWRDVGIGGPAGELLRPLLPDL